MRARVYDSDTKTYYLSEVYAEVIWEGYHYSIVENPKAEEFTLRVAADMDFSVQPFFCNIEMIDAYVDKRKMSWRQWENLDALNRILEEMYGRKGITFFCGCDCFLSHVEATAGLLAEGEALGAAVGLSRVISYMEGWNYLENEQDIAKLMKEFSGFHDSVIRDFRYLSGDYVKEDYMVCVPSCQKTVQILFDSDWNPSVEIVFEAPPAGAACPARRKLSGRFI